MYKYDDEEETLITVLGTQYMVKPDTGTCKNTFCQGCVFNDPTAKLLLPEVCKEMPCVGTERWDEQHVILVEVPDGNT